MHVTHFMAGHRRVLCGTGSSNGHPIADVHLGSFDWQEVTCKRCQAAKVRRSTPVQPKAPAIVEASIDPEPLNPVKREGMAEVKVFFGEKCRVVMDGVELKSFPLTDHTVKRIIKYCDRNNLFPVNIRDGKVW